MQPQVLVVGEALVDLFAEPGEGSLRTATSFRPRPGGEAANTAIWLTRLGVPTALCARVGGGAFGDLLCDTLAGEGVLMDSVVRDPDRATGLVFLHTRRADGSREFQPYREGTAEAALCAADLPAGPLVRAHAVHLGTSLMRWTGGRAATLQAADTVRARGGLVSVDANLRTRLWPTPDAAQEAADRLLERAHLFKANEREAEFLVPGHAADPIAAARALQARGPALAVVTLGARGCAWAAQGGLSGESRAHPCEAVDATGAGDAFAAGLLSVLLDAARPLDRQRVERAIEAGLRAGALATARLGAT